MCIVRLFHFSQLFRYLFRLDLLCSQLFLFQGQDRIKPGRIYVIVIGVKKRGVYDKRDQSDCLYRENMMNDSYMK